MTATPTVGGSSNTVTTMPQFSVRMLFACTAVAGFILAIIHPFAAIVPEKDGWLRLRMITGLAIFFGPLVAGAVVGIVGFRKLNGRELVGGMIGGTVGSFVLTVILSFADGSLWREPLTLAGFLGFGACVGGVIGAIISVISPKANQTDV